MNTAEGRDSGTNVSDGRHNVNRARKGLAACNCSGTGDVIFPENRQHAALTGRPVTKFMVFVPAQEQPHRYTVSRGEKTDEKRGEDKRKLRLTGRTNSSTFPQLIPGGHMKRTMMVTLSLMLAVALTATAVAGSGKSAPQPAFNKEVVEANLLAGVQSENFGLRTSAAAMLGDLKSSQAVIPLMRMLRSESDERARVVAALALFKIGDPVGIYAVKQTGRLDDNDRVRKLCALFYNVFEHTRITG